MGFLTELLPWVMYTKRNYQSRKCVKWLEPNYIKDGRGVSTSSSCTKVKPKCLEYGSCHLELVMSFRARVCAVATGQIHAHTRVHSVEFTAQLPKITRGGVMTCTVAHHHAVHLFYIIYDYNKKDLHRKSNWALSQNQTATKYNQSCS